jgi:multidrug resistance efflux pump
LTARSGAAGQRATAVFAVSPLAGAISEVLVDDNQLLKKGDPIARLDPRDYEMALAQAGANLSEKIHFVALFRFSAKPRQNFRIFE